MRIKPWCWSMLQQVLLQLFISILMASIYYYTILSQQYQQIILLKKQQMQLRKSFAVRYLTIKTNKETYDSIQYLIKNYPVLLKKFSHQFNCNDFIIQLIAFCQHFDLAPITAKPLPQRTNKMNGMVIMTQPIELTFYGSLRQTTFFLQSLHQLPWSIDVKNLQTQDQNHQQEFFLQLEVYHL